MPETDKEVAERELRTILDKEDAEKQRREEATRIRTRVHAEIVKALLELSGLSIVEASDITQFISEGKIPHVSITY